MTPAERSNSAAQVIESASRSTETQQWLDYVDRAVQEPSFWDANAIPVRLGLWL